MGPAPQLEFVTAVSESLRQARSLRVKEVLLSVLGGTAVCARHNCGGGCVTDGPSLRFAMVDYLLQYQLAIKASNTHVKDSVKRYYEAAYEEDRAKREDPSAVHADGDGDGRLVGRMAPCLVRAAVMHLFIRPSTSRQGFSDCSNSIDVYALFMVTWASDAIALGVAELPMPEDGEWSPAQLSAPPEEPVELAELGPHPWERVNRVWFYRRVRHWLYLMRTACVGKIPWAIEAEAMSRFEVAADLLCKAAGPLDLPAVESFVDPDDEHRTPPSSASAATPSSPPPSSQGGRKKRKRGDEDDDDSSVHVVSSSDEYDEPDDDDDVIIRSTRGSKQEEDLGFDDDDDEVVDIGGGASSFSSSRAKILSQLVEMGFSRASAADAYDARAGTQQSHAIELQDILDLLM